MTGTFNPIICSASATTIAGRHVQVTDAALQPPAKASHATGAQLHYKYRNSTIEIALIASITALFLFGLHEVGV